MTTITRSTAANVVAAAIRSQFPRHAIPTIAANNGITAQEVHNLLVAYGYPDKARMKAAYGKLIDSIQDQDSGDDTAVVPADAPTAPPTAPDTDSASKREPYITALSANVLFADQAYQRELDELRVQRMVNAYDPALIGIIEVSHRPHPEGDRYAILDGQHRVAVVRDHAFEAMAVPHVACRIHTGLTIDEEANLYHRLNTTRKQLTGWDRWKARKSSADATVLAIEEAANAAGFTISYRLTRGTITATKACESVYNLGGTELLGQVLDVIRTAWRDDPDGTTQGIIQGLAHILVAYPDDVLDPDRLVEALSGIVPRQLNARAAAVREIHKGTIDKLTAHVIVEQYNQLRRAGQIQPFFAVVQPGSPNKGTKRAAEVERTAAIRTWAIENGLIASDRSKVTAAIRDRYAARRTTAPEAVSA